MPTTTAGQDLIDFSVAGTLTLASGLPSITDELTIDGTTAPGYYPTETPTFIIDGDFTVFTANNPSTLSIQGLDLSKSGAQGGTGFDLYVDAGTVTIQNCKVSNRHRGIICIGNANWTVTDNDLTTSGLNQDNPALYFQSVSTGTIAASDNLFGGAGANTALRLHDVSGKIIGDETASPAADILIKDADGLMNLTGDGFSIFTTNCSNLTFDNLDVSKPTVSQSGTGIYLGSSSGAMTVKNCKVNNRHTGIFCQGNANWTVTDNDLTTSGLNQDNPALYFQSVSTGTIAASDNLFGGANANTALRLHDCSDKIIGDETASPAADILIKDADGLMNLTGDGFSIFTTNCSNLTFDNLDVSKPTVSQSGTGIYLGSSSGAMIVKNCKVNNRHTGIFCQGNANWTVTDNDLTTSGLNQDNPALYFQSVSTGTIAASDNLFGGANANTALRLQDCSDKIIGDETASPAADIVIKDADGLMDLTGEGISIFTTNCSNLTFDNLDVSKLTGSQAGTGLYFENSSGTMTVKDCKAKNHHRGIVCQGNANWTVTDNDLTTSGLNQDNPALYFQSVSTGTIAASDNLFGGANANTALRLQDCSDKIIGDETASPAADIVIKDADGLMDLTGEGISIFTTNCSNLTFDNLDVSKLTGSQAGTGLYFENSSGTMTVKDCKAKNHHRGIVCLGNANWTVTGNDLTASGLNHEYPALYFIGITTGTIAASNNQFGGAGANSALRMEACSGKIIGDENASPAADILIKDADGLTDLTGDGISIFTAYCSNLTFDNLDVSKTTGAQAGQGIYLDYSSGSMTVKNCTVNNRNRGIFCGGSANWTVTGNDLATSGMNYDHPALYFYNVTTGTIAASDNLFGGTGANTALRLHDCSDKIIGDENASPAADILIKDADGLNNLGGEGTHIIYASNCSNLTFDGLDVSSPTTPAGIGIQLDYSSGNMTVKNCTVHNRHRGLGCHGNANWTITGNDLTTSGLNYEHPALYLSGITTGTIAASDNLFGGMGANTALRLHDCWNKIIGDENASPAANIVIKDTDGLTNLTGNGISIYATDCANLTFDNLAVSQKTPATIGTGIQLDNCLGDMDFKNLTVTKLNEGIIFNSPSANLELTCSAIYRNSIGVRVYSSGGATILNNNFKENTYRSVVNSSSFPPVDAQSNYWLNADGSTTPADAVNGYTGDVNVDPALSAPAGCASAFPAPARFYVDVDATAGANNGTWWTDAFTDLQSAVGLAYAGDEIWVAEGTYYPTADGNQGVYFNVRGGVKIYGGFDGTEDELTDRVLAGNETILSGDIGNAGDVADNSDILMAISNATAETRVDGFTFSGANNGYTSGALSIANGTVINCIFRNNTAYAGGGMSIGGGTVNLENCLFHDNYGGAGGGAISSGDGTLVATNCIFRNNRGGDSGGAFFSQASPNATFTNCLFYGQSVISYDGAVMFSGGTVSLDHCTVVGQHEPPGAGFARHRQCQKLHTLEQPVRRLGRRHVGRELFHYPELFPRHWQLKRRPAFCGCRRPGWCRRYFWHFRRRLGAQPMFPGD
jgi:parallel beta-helix repeat protein